MATTNMRCRVELLNLITGSHVLLPSFATIPGIKVVPVRTQDPGVSFENPAVAALRPPPFFYDPKLRLRKVTLCRTPAQRSGYQAVALFSSWHGELLVAFTVFPDKQWTRLQNPHRELYLGSYVDVTIHKGEVLAMIDSSYIYRWDMKGGTAVVPAMLPRPDIHIDNIADGRAFYLTSSSGSDLQLACMYGKKDADYKDRRCLRVINSQFHFFARRILLQELDAGTGVW